MSRLTKEREEYLRARKDDEDISNLIYEVDILRSTLKHTDETLKAIKNSLEILERATTQKLGCMKCRRYQFAMLNLIGTGKGILNSLGLSHCQKKFPGFVESLNKAEIEIYSDKNSVNLDNGKKAIKE